MLTYIKQERPGLVVISPPCEAFSVLNRLLDKFRRNNLDAMKRHLAKLKKGKILLNFAMQVCHVCHEQGTTFVFEHPRCASSWKMPSVQRLLRQTGVILALADQCVFGLTDLHGQLHKKPTGFVTNNRTVAEALSKRCPRDHHHAWIWGSKAISKRAQNYPPDLVDAILSSYSRSIGKAPQEIRVQPSAKIIAEDYQHDLHYFAPFELEEIAQEFQKEDFEILAREEVEPELPDLIEMNKPEALGITEDLVDGTGWKQIPTTKHWIYVGENEPEIVSPPADHEARSRPWRSTWTRVEGRWVIFEDEVRWQDLRMAPRLEPGTSYLSVYQMRLDERADKKMRHFPGMARVTLERMIRRAHEGLGHPEHSRFMRILRQSNASEEVLEAAQKFQCATCQAYKLPEAVRKGAPPKEELFINEKVGVDTVHLRDHNNDAIPSLNIIDFHTHFQLVIPMSAESASEVRKAYRQWIRFFGVPRKVLFDLGTEFKAEFRRQVENDGSEALPSALETPTQRGLTERAGGVFKDILYKSMIDYRCQTREEWRELVDVACMTRNRLLLRGGYSPIQRVIGYTPRLPGGLLTGGEDDHATAAKMVVGDKDVVRSMKMRKAAAVAFHAADCDQALRSAALAGPRKVSDFEVGQAVYFWRRGAGSTKKTRQSYWAGPGRVVMTSLPNAVWIAYNNLLVKASPERVRHASSEENLSVSGWLRGISQTRQDFEKIPKKGFLDLTNDPAGDPGLPQQPEEVDPEADDSIPGPAREPQSEAAPLRRVRQKTAYSRIRQEPPQDQEPEPGLPDGPLPSIVPRLEDDPEPLDPSLRPPGLFDADNDMESAAMEDTEAQADGVEPETSSGIKREAEEDLDPPGKRSRMHLIEVYHLHLQGLAKQRQKKESKASDFKGVDYQRLQTAILKEINNNLSTQAYELLSRAESQQIEKHKPEKIMESRYVITKKPLEPAEVSKGGPS